MNSSKNNLLRELGNLLRLGRNELGMRQDEVRGLAEGACHSTISGWEKGRSGLRPLVYAIQLARLAPSLQLELLRLIDPRYYTIARDNKILRVQLRRALTALHSVESDLGPKELAQAEARLLKREAELHERNAAALRRIDKRSPSYHPEFREFMQELLLWGKHTASEDD